MFTMPHANAPLVAVIGEDGHRAKTKGPAREFYRCAFVDAAFAYAEARTPHIVMVSTDHCAMKPTQLVWPEYAITFSNLSADIRRNWGKRVVTNMLPWVRITPLSAPPVLLLLCRNDHAEAILEGANHHNLPRPMTPLAKIRGTAKRIEWLERELVKLQEDAAT